MTALAVPAAALAGSSTAGPPTGRDKAMVPTLVLVGFVVAVMSSVGAPLIPSIAKASHVSLSAGEWLLTITLLTGALATTIMGRLADGPIATRTRRSHDTGSLERRDMRPHRIVSQSKRRRQFIDAPPTAPK